MLSCKQVSELVSHSLDQPLPLGRRIAVRIHLFMCKVCSTYQRQLRFLQRATRDLPEHVDDSHAAHTLPEEAKQRIRAALKAKK